MWLTNKKTGKVFNTDWVNDDAIRKEKQISANKAQSKKLNTEASIKYEKMLSLEEKHQMLYAFADRTGVQVNMSNIRDIPDDTFNMIFDTVENHLANYGKKNFSIDNITMEESDDWKEHPNWMASMSLSGTLYLNPKYFNKSKKDLDEIMQKAYEDNTYHPKGDASSIIIHELGHARFNKVLADSWAKCVMKERDGSTMQDFDSVYDVCVSENWLDDRDLFNVELYRKNSFYRKFFDRMDDFTKRTVESDYLKKKWGGPVRLSLKGLVNTQTNYTDAVSRYAATNIHEMMAEAWVDAVQHDNKASYMSKRIVEEFLHVTIDASEIGKALRKRG